MMWHPNTRLCKKVEAGLCEGIRNISVPNQSGEVNAKEASRKLSPRKGPHSTASIKNYRVLKRALHDCMLDQRTAVAKGQVGDHLLQLAVLAFQLL
jgi:hypothetical protein